MHCRSAGRVLFDKNTQHLRDRRSLQQERSISTSKAEPGSEGEGGKEMWV